MSTLPELLEEDVQEIESALKYFLAKSEATLALVTAEGGFLIVKQGDSEKYDSTTLGALASNAFSAAQAIGSITGETTFTHIYQQGDKSSLLVSDIDGYNTMVVVFPSSVSVGIVKYYATPTVAAIAAQFSKAEQRPTNRGIDLAMLNLPDSSVLFQQKPA
ncbi:MAG: hypothetical protein EXS31_06030 [Pedosphaera sp.]|nr:hypothetical protein [Pedosphaera sp.]